MLRTDGGSADAGSDAEDLARNFLRIWRVMTNTDAAQGNVVQCRNRKRRCAVGKAARSASASEFGASVPADEQATDRARVASFVRSAWPA